jgi:hypothetical protein
MLLLTNSQIKRLSNVFDNAGQVLFGYLVIGQVVGSGIFIKVTADIVSGILITVLFWYISLTLEGRSL